MPSPLFRAVLSRLFTSGCAVLTSFVSLKLYSLFLTTEKYGVILVGVQIISYLPLTGAGFIGVLNQRLLTDHDGSSSKQLSAFSQLLQNYLFLIAIGVALLLMAAYAETSVARTSGLPFVLFLFIGFSGAVTFYVSGQLSFLVGHGGQVESYFFQGVMNLLAALILYGAFAAGWGVWAFPVSACLSAALIFVPIRFALQRRATRLPLFGFKGDPDFLKRLREIWHSAFANLLSQLSAMLTFTLDTILVGLIVGPGPAAVYGVIARVTSISRHVLQALGEASWPRLAQQPTKELKARLMRKVDRLNAWNVGCWFGTVFATIVPFMNWLLKADWVAGYFLISLILIRHAIISLSGPHAFGLTSLGLFKENARLSWLEVILSVVPAVILSYWMGSVGTALGYLIGTLGVSSWQLTRLYFVSSGQPWVSEWCGLYMRGLFSGVLSFALATLMWKGSNSLWHLPGWSAIIVAGIALATTWSCTAGVELWRTHFNPLKA